MSTKRWEGEDLRHEAGWRKLPALTKHFCLALHTPIIYKCLACEKHSPEMIKKFFPTGKNNNMVMISNVKLFSMLVTELTSNWLKLCGWKLSNLIIDLSILSLSSKCLSLVLFFQWYAVHVLISIRSADVIMVDSCRKLCICLN